MKVLATVKRVIDYNSRPRIRPDNSGVDLSGVKMAMNPFDEIAVEEAVQLKEKGIATEVVVVTIGGQAAQETLRTALAVGADRAIHVVCEQDLQPPAVARLLKAIVEREKPDLVITGKQAIDGDYNQTGQMLAAILNWPQGAFASKLEIADGKATVTVETDSGLQTLSLTLPAVVTADLRLNQPRYASLPNIMKAKKKPLDSLNASELGVSLDSNLRIIKVTEPLPRKGGIMVADVDTLLAKLRDEAKVI